DRVIAAAAQRQRQSALDPAGGDARHEISEPAERARREACQHVVFGEPARTAIALGKEAALFAVDGFEMAAVASRHLDAGGPTNIETGFIMDHDDVRPHAFGMTGV